MTSVLRSAGRVAGGALGAAVTAAAVAAVVHHNHIGELRRNHIGELRRNAAGLPPALSHVLPPDREYTVTADDGVALSVEELDPADGGAPELTAILIHGWTLDRRSWVFQRHCLARSTAPRVRQVLYDHRGHGRSGRSPRGAYTIEQLGRDLHAVIRAAAPEGPVALIGHSLGGMTIMALAEDHPELFAERIRAVALLNTSAGDLGRSGLAKRLLSRRNPLVPVASRLARWGPGARAVDRGREACGNLSWSLTRKIVSDDEAVDPALVDLLHVMAKATSFEVLTDFLAEFGTHHRYAALAALRHTKTLVLGADGDRLIQYEHSEAMAALLPDAQLVRVRGAGHVTMLEQPKRVNDHLLELLSRCAEAGV
ncbi:MAG: alpha/beta fold hydrolase [Pseudonocardiaceae bacterium]